MDFGPYAAVSRRWNRAEWEFNIDFHRRYAALIGWQAWEVQEKNRHTVFMMIFDDLTSALDCTTASFGLTEADKSARRELVIQLNIQHYEFMRTIQEIEFARENDK